MMSLESNPVLEVSTKEIVSFLQGSNWPRILDRNPNFIVFQSPADEDGQTLEIALPITDKFLGSKKIIETAIEIISTVTDSTIEEVISKIKGRNRDLLLCRLISNDSSDHTLSLGSTLNFLNSFYEYLAFSYCANRNPKQRYFSQVTPSGRRVAQQYRFAQTFPGSFGFTIESPLYKTDEGVIQQTLPSLGIYRHTVERAVRGLIVAQDAIERNDPNIIVNKYADALNANMCKSLLTYFAEASEESEIEYTIEWSAITPPADDLTDTKRIRLYHASEVLSEAYKLLIEENILTEDVQTLRGFIVALNNKGTKEQRDFSRREVVLHPSNQDNYIYLELPNDVFYATACDAHKDKQEIEVIGTLHKTYRKQRMDNIIEFRILPVSDNL